MAVEAEARGMPRADDRISFEGALVEWPTGVGADVGDRTQLPIAADDEDAESGGVDCPHLAFRVVLWNTHGDELLRPVEEGAAVHHRPHPEHEMAAQPGRADGESEAGDREPDRGGVGVWTRPPAQAEGEGFDDHHHGHEATVRE